MKPVVKKLMEEQIKKSKMLLAQKDSYHRQLAVLQDLKAKVAAKSPSDHARNSGSTLDQS